MSRLVLCAGVVLCSLLLSVNGVDIGRPTPLRNKLQVHRARLGESVVGAAENEKLEHLRVAAAEREGDSLADRFAMDLATHVAAKAAEKVEAEAVAGMETDSESGATVTADLASDSDIEAMQSIDVVQAAENVANSVQAGGLSIETLQELEYQRSSVNAKKSGKRVKLQTEKMMWSNCQYSSSKSVGVSTLKYVTLRSMPPIRDQSLVIEIDGSYKGPDVTYGSVTLQIARLSSQETQAKDMPELVYRHSIVLSDMVSANPFRAADPLSLTMYVPTSAFNMYAPAGEYVLTVVLTNQDKQPFGCAKIEFQLA